MSEPNSTTQPAGAGLSDEEMVETVAEQTDSASEHADVAGKDWDGNPGDAGCPTSSATSRGWRTGWRSCRPTPSATSCGCSRSPR